MDRDAIDRLLDTIDRQLEDVHFPPEYWDRVMTAAQDCIDGDGDFMPNYVDSIDAQGNVGRVYARRMAETMRDLIYCGEVIIRRDGVDTDNCLCGGPNAYDPEVIRCWSCDRHLMRAELPFADDHDGLCPVCAYEILPRLAGRQDELGTVLTNQYKASLKLAAE